MRRADTEPETVELPDLDTATVYDSNGDSRQVSIGSLFVGAVETARSRLAEQMYREHNGRYSLTHCIEAMKGKK